MKKIRINELARELEVKAHEILDRLPELGVAEKKTHSSSIDEDVAIKLRRLYGFDGPGAAPYDDSGEESQASEPEEQPERSAPPSPTAQHHHATSAVRRVRSRTSGAPRSQTAAHDFAQTRPGSIGSARAHAGFVRDTRRARAASSHRAPHADRAAPADGEPRIAAAGP